MAEWKSLEQREGESPKAYQAFLDYIALGPTRSQVELREKYERESGNGQVVPTTRATTIAEWSIKYEWVKRVQDFLKEQRTRIGDRHRERFLKILDKSFDQLEKLNSHLDTQIDELQKLRITKRHRVPADPNNPNGGVIETVTLKVNAQDLNNLIKAQHDLQKSIRAQLGEKDSLEINAEAAEGKIKLYIGVSPDDWDSEDENGKSKPTAEKQDTAESG